MKEYEGLELYELSFSEEEALTMQDFAIQKNLIQIPTYMIVNKPLDWKLMEKAVDIEIQRNDCLRLHFVKIKGKVKQYFIPELHVSNIPFDDFTGKSKEEMVASLKKDAATPIRFFKGEIFRIRFFRSWDGRDGVYMNVCHVNTDLASVLIFFKDLFAVYFALLNGEELPKPLNLYKDSLQKELEDKNNEKKVARGEKFFTEFITLQIKWGKCVFYMYIREFMTRFSDGESFNNRSMRACSCCFASVPSRYAHNAPV